MTDGLQMKYFVLNPKGNSLHARACQAAMLEYAEVIYCRNSQLSLDIQDWIEKERENADSTENKT